MADANPNPLAIVEVSDVAKPEDREYRKGNWTLHETVVLIAAKKLDDERRLKGGDKEKTKTAEFRWKWVENYCWKHGCHRSQNQCNDKWDNLLRDYKKVRDHETRNPAEPVSYWQMERHERKEKGLPSNLSYQVYEALHDVIDRRYPPKLLTSDHLPPISSTPTPLLPMSPPRTSTQPTSAHPTVSVFGSTGFNIAEKTSNRWPIQVHLKDFTFEDADSSDSEDSAVAKKRRISRGSEGLAPAMFKSTVELSKTLLECEDKRDRRHRDLIGVEERKLHIEETKTEISRVGVAGLITAVNNLASAVLSLSADRTVGDTS